MACPCVAVLALRTEDLRHFDVVRLLKILDQTTSGIGLQVQPVTVGIKIIRAFAIIFAVFLWFDWPTKRCTG